jgi:branched-chain amino acid transport system substrate-binding protein
MIFPSARGGLFDAEERGGDPAMGPRGRIVGLVLASLSLLWGVIALSHLGEKKQPIRIGLSATLSGRLSELGISCRQGAHMAVAERNAAGGVLGRPVEMLVADDRGTSSGAVSADLGLLRRGVSVIIGHSSSQTTLAAREALRDRKVLLLGPYATTELLSGRDDNFVRVSPSFRGSPERMGESFLRLWGARRISVAMGEGNRAFTEDWMRNFEGHLRKLGASVVRVERVDSLGGTDYESAARRLTAPRPGAILLLTSPLDAALLAQRLRLGGYRGALGVSVWGMGEALLENGGGAVEGLLGVSNFWPDERDSTYAGFRRRFLAWTGREPDPVAVLAYEAGRILLDAMEETGSTDPDRLRAWLSGRTFRGGPSGIFSIDRYGDSIRPPRLFEVRDGILRERIP